MQYGCRGAEQGRRKENGGDFQKIYTHMRRGPSRHAGTLRQEGNEEKRKKNEMR